MLVACDARWHHDTRTLRPGMPERSSILLCRKVPRPSVVVGRMRTSIAGWWRGHRDPPTLAVDPHRVQPSSAPSAVADQQGHEGEASECTRTYADKQEKDRCREPGQDVELSGYTISVSELVRHEEEFIGEQLCANVAIANRDDESQPYSSFDFRLQSPGGTIDDATIPFREPDLGSGDLAPGGRKQGWVCFEDTGAGGEHIVIWKPDAFTADRGLWFFTV